MSRYLIEVVHEPKVLACVIAAKVLMETGSHFITNADWGCEDGNHTAWIVVDVDSKEEARAILPPPFRAQARITRLNKFLMEDINHLIDIHQPEKQQLARL